MYEKYIVEGLSDREIAYLIGCGKATVVRARQKHGIYREDVKMCDDYTLDNISEDLRTFIDGLLLGDACITEKGNLLITQNKRYDWLEYVKHRFQQFGLNVYFHCYKYKRRTSEVIADLYVLSTSRYELFRQLRERWYPDGIKRIPNDLVINDEGLAQWYLGDGSLTKQKNGYKLELSTHGFTLDENKFLQQKLKLLYGFDFRISKKHQYRYLRLFKSKQVHAFCSIVEPFIPPSYRNKVRCLHDYQWLKSWDVI
ncbi:RNA maturase isolog [Methanocaldococcus jannaschii DSM 2661]|uniref:Uncharacterized protein MJ1098 n=1 Tax=Methanocaldococcus jannaschii (strain ATCC 43067 / DSM 2661 / JAL-1 / JCM 10045 / NBRC 100440) TaxID=243232 RepID=Y1098_METJA|nr:hypothetical protein [Methanocaldococcus jannaschii]Q58498.1 RecName: Full=Uncharacterized protein MJ1098 [Methanocaldococcus jannaschii DSM 2661]AAB99101.1 RNA maturase isolog [Methanocaldococcus jannaschii DSM 2661]